MANAIAPPDPGAEHFRLLLELAYDLSGSLDIGEVLTRSLAATRRLIDFRGGSIQLIEEGTLRIAVADPPVSSEVAELRLPLGTGLSGRAATTGSTIYSPDLDDDPRVDPEVRRLGSNQGIRSYLAVPVVARGDVVGVLQIDSSTPDAFSDEQRSMIATLAPLMGSAIQNAQIFAAELDMEDHARELDRLGSSFLTIATHELRTPLSPLIGFAELLTRIDMERVMDVHEIVSRLRRAVDKMRYLVAQMELATRPHSDVDSKPAEVATAVETAVARVRDRRQVIVDIERDLPQASFDVTLLVDALDALLTNSINFSPDGSAVSIEARHDDGWITIAVIDHGPGVAPEDAQRIFEPFAQLQDPQTREVGGLGIGLATARALVERMGGRLDVVAGGEGRFVISLRAEERL